MPQVEQTASVIEPQTIKGEHLMTINAFSTLDYGVGKRVSSPIFKLVENDWQIDVHPGGSNEERKGCLSVIVFSLGLKDVVVPRVCFEIVDAKGGTLLSEVVATPTVFDGHAQKTAYSGKSAAKLIARDALLNPASGLLDNDTLRLRITIERTMAQSRAVVPFWGGESATSSLASSIGSLLEASESRCVLLI